MGGWGDSASERCVVFENWRFVVGIHRNCSLGGIVGGSPRSRAEAILSCWAVSTSKGMILAMSGPCLSRRTRQISNRVQSNSGCSLKRGRNEQRNWRLVVLEVRMMTSKAHSMSFAGHLSALYEASVVTPSSCSDRGFISEASASDQCFPTLGLTTGL